jgi:AraC family ethanolamine operon transcriptional activator
MEVIQMESPNTDGHQFSLAFDGFDAFADATRGWDLDFWQLDGGPFRAELTQTLTASVILVECSFSRKIEQHGSPPSGYRTFGFAANEVFDLQWRGKTVGPQNLMLFPPGGELESISRPGFHVFAFSVLERTLEAAASRRGLDSVATLFPATDLITSPRKIMSNIRNHARMLSRTASVVPGLAGHQPLSSSLELDLVNCVLDAITMGTVAEELRPCAVTRTQAVKRALDIIADRADEPVSVAELSRLAGVSDRTLRYAFEEAYGLSPKQYIQAYRLNKVHRLLLGARDQGLNVSDAANAWGFWHMGQFARDYRRMFGALPHATMGPV